MARSDCKNPNPPSPSKNAKGMTTSHPMVGTPTGMIGTGGKARFANAPRSTKTSGKTQPKVKR